MEHAEIEKVLQKISSVFLVKTKHTESDPEYHVGQTHKVVEKLSELANQCPDLLARLTDDIQAVPVKDISKRHDVENIGSSAGVCLEYVKEGLLEKTGTSTETVELANRFFEIVLRQAKDICQQYDEVRDENGNETATDIQNQYLERIQDFFNDSANDLNLRIKMAQEAAATASAEASKASDAADQAQKGAQAAETASQNAVEQASGILPNMLTILGIFVAIIFAVVACYLSIVLAQHGEGSATVMQSRPLEFAKYLLMGHISLGVIFLLLYLVSKFTPYSLASSCSRFEPQQDTSAEEQNNARSTCDCSKCKNKCSAPAHLRLRYPYVYGFNLAFAIGYAVLWLWQVVNVYYRTALNNAVAKAPFLMALIFIVAGLIPVIALMRIFRRGRVSSNPSSLKDKEENK